MLGGLYISCEGEWPYPGLSWIFEKRMLGWKLHFRKIALFCSKKDGLAEAGMVAGRPQLGDYCRS